MRRALAAMAVAAILALSGCAADDGYTDAAAQSLQGAVLAVTQASSTGDWATAQAALDETATRLTAAVEAGDISEERAAEIIAAIAEVRADLDALIAAQENDTDSNNGNGPDGEGPPGQEDKDDKKDGKKDG